MSNSPSSSSIPSPSSKLSLSQLPVELLRQIIEQSVPSYYHSLTYHNRQTTLRILSLTSRLFREIAQPILERFDRIRFSSHKCDSVDQLASPRASRTNVLSISLEVEMPLERMNTLLSAYGQLKELHIDSTWNALQDIDVSLLATLPCGFSSPFVIPEPPSNLQHPTSEILAGLESLSMHQIRITFVPRHPLLALKSLTLSRCDGDFDSLFAQASYLPSLKVLALPDDNGDVYNSIYNNELLAQLELFVGDPDSFEEQVPKEHGDKFLSAYRFDACDSASVHHFKTRHFRLRVSPVDLETAYDVEDLYEALNTIRGFLDAAGPPLKTLFLDQGLRDALDPYRFTQVTYDGLIETCEERGIEVIFEEQAVMESADSAITPELLRWMDRRKESARLLLDVEAKMERR